MSISALSSGFVSSHAPSGAAPPAAIRREAPPAAVEAHRHAEHRPGGRQHRLEQAMMSALRELGFVGPTAAASTTPAPTAVASAQVAEPNAVINGTTAATAVQAGSPAKADALGDVEAASAPSDSVESAVRGFAHALFQALRQAGNSADNADRRADGVHGHRHHHGHHHGVRQSYGNFAQRLEGLAQTFGTNAPAPVATGSVADSSIQPPPFAPPSPVETTVAEPVAADVAVAKPPKNALLEAFSKLYAALNPPDVDTATEADMVAKMRQFLHAFAQALRPDLMIDAHAPQVGGLVDVTA